jgi:hypothetical protein
MTLPNPICLWQTLWRGLRGYLTVGHRIAGHDMVEDTRLNNCIVTVLKCQRCETYHVGWEPTPRSTREPYPDER